jgi:hypothetical protein
VEYICFKLCSFRLHIPLRLHVHFFAHTRQTCTKIIHSTVINCISLYFVKHTPCWKVFQIYIFSVQWADLGARISSVMSVRLFTCSVISKQLGVCTTLQFWETDSDSTSNWKRIWLWTRPQNLNCYTEFKPEVNVFSKAWPRLAPRPVRAASNGRSRAK